MKHIDTEYSLWKTIWHIKRLCIHVSPIWKEDGYRAHSEQDKADVYAQYLEHVFQPNDIASKLDMIQCEPLDEIRKKIWYFTLLEVAYQIDTNINSIKAAGFNEISSRILKKLPKNAIILLEQIYNAIIKWKKEQVIMLLKPGKPVEWANLYRPISLLPSILKIFKKSS